MLENTDLGKLIVRLTLGGLLLFHGIAKLLNGIGFIEAQLASHNRAYLCHRLMEEMHDNNRSIRAGELIDLEATRANLLAHELIGEPFANELDDAITVTVLQIAGTPDYYDLDLDPFVEQFNNRAWDWMRNYWENLLERNHIRFSLGPAL